MANIKDVARVAGVSIATVSRVINGNHKVGDACRARVQKVIKELGYRPNSNAQALVSKTKSTIGLVTPKLAMTFFGTLAAGVEKTAREQHYKLLMANSMYETQSELDAINSLRDHNCQAIVLHSEYSDEKTLIKLAEEIPGLVLVNRYIPAIAHRCVWLDNIAGAACATQMLLDRQHRDFAVITSIYQNRDPGARLQGIRQTLAAANITLPEHAIEESTANIEGGMQAVAALLARNVRFTALLAYNDLMAVGAIHALFAAGLRIPEDVSVVGFDDLIVARACRPQLTTMHYPVEAMASYAAELAIALSSQGASQKTSLKDSPNDNLQLNQHRSGAELRTHLFLSTLIERDSVASR